MFRDQIDCYKAIGDTLAIAAKNPWSSITAEIALQDNRIDAVVSYIDADSGTSGYLTGVPMLARYFYELARLVNTEEKGLFKRCVFTLNSSGSYDANFVYE
jgi:hypothetical protein